MRAILTAAALVLALAGCGDAADQAPATAEVTYPGVPEAQAQQIRALGHVIDVASFDIFAPLVPAPPYDDVTIASDVAYGSDPAHKLDIYTLNAAPPGDARPVLIYVHGGGFVEGSKVGDYYPQSATAWAARNGMVG